MGRYSRGVPALMPSSPTAALGLLPSVALSSEPAAKGYHCCIKGQEDGAT